MTERNSTPPGNDDLDMDVRIIASTNRDLTAMVEAERFREE